MTGVTVTFEVEERELADAIRAFTKAKLVDLGRVLRVTMSGILSELQLVSPVDTGRFRAGWSPFLIHVGFPLDEGPDGVAVAEGRARSTFVDESSSSVRPFISVTNGVTYGPDLNAGRSPQAPAQFVEGVLNRWRQHLHAAARAA